MLANISGHLDLCQPSTPGNNNKCETKAKGKL